MLSLDQRSLRTKIANFICSALTMHPRRDGKRLNADRHPSRLHDDLRKQVMLFIHCTKSLKYREISSVLSWPHRKKVEAEKRT